MSRPAGNGLVRVVALLGAGLLAVLVVAAPPSARSTAAHAVSAAADDHGVDATADDRDAPNLSPLMPAVGSGYGSTLSALASASPVASTLESANDGVIPAHWTNKSVEVRIGPSQGYVVIGQLPRNARLQIVGRDESSRWIAIVFSPGSKLTGWIEASSIIGQIDAASLMVMPVTLLTR